MRRKNRIKMLTDKQIGEAVFFASWMRETHAAKLVIGFHDKDDKLIAHIDLWDDPQAHGEIVRWFDGRYYFRTYRDRRAKLYTMTLAKFKYLKSRLA